MSFARTFLVLLQFWCSVPIKAAGYGDLQVFDSNHFELVGDPRTYICSTNTRLTCKYEDDDVLGKQIRWVRYNDDMTLESNIVGKELKSKKLNVTLLTSGHYACEYYQRPRSTINITIVLKSGNGGCRDRHSIISTTPNLVATVTPTVTPTLVTTVTVSSSPTSFSRTSHFVGLNPLIYTTITALLLVILTLVAIITCWLRSRKMSSQRTLLPQESPQDYLDYIREGQFTPLTTSEFLASLHERPPTYLESQDIQRRMDTEDEEEETPPPLPPRNMTTQRQETSSSSDHGTSHDRSHDATPSVNEPLQDPSSLVSSPDPLIDSSLMALQDPLVPLQDPMVLSLSLQEPIQSDEYNDGWPEERDENAPLINHTIR